MGLEAWLGGEVREEADVTQIDGARRLNLLDGQFYAGDPWPTYRWLRDEHPVYRDEVNGIWVVSKYEDISYVERQPELFCSGQGVRPKGGGADALSIVSMDDPEHARHRAEVRACNECLGTRDLDAGIRTRLSRRGQT